MVGSTLHWFHVISVLDGQRMVVLDRDGYGHELEGDSGKLMVVRLEDVQPSVVGHETDHGLSLCPSAIEAPALFLALGVQGVGPLEEKAGQHLDHKVLDLYFQVEVLTFSFLYFVHVIQYLALPLSSITRST